jgi:hypothetical protein
MVRQGKEWKGKVRHGREIHDKARIDMARQGMELHGKT